MHELSLARALVAQVLRLADEHDASAVETVRVRVGAFSGVEPALLASALVQLIPDTIAAGAHLDIESVALAARCPSCGSAFHPDGFRFRCPSCGSKDTEITAGEELVLKDVTLALRPRCGHVDSPSNHWR